jgi:hypothetical protein
MKQTKNIQVGSSLDNEPELLRVQMYVLIIQQGVQWNGFV